MHEIYRAQGFPEWQDYRGVKYVKDKQVVRCGNVVPPPFAEALVRANLPKKVSDAGSGLNYNRLNTRGDFYVEVEHCSTKPGRAGQG